MTEIRLEKSLPSEQERVGQPSVPAEGLERYFAREGVDPLPYAFEGKIAVHPGLGGSGVEKQDFEATLEPLLAEPRTGKTVAYIHVPFCETHCLYCGFYNKAYREDESRIYADALIQELRLWRGRPGQDAGPVHAVYMGGGTPTALREKKPVMLASLAERFGVSELEVARALPDEARAFAGKDAFDTVWQALASWENATFIMAHLGSVIEIKGKIPEGRHGHGYFNLSGGSGLGGHLKIDDLGHICFLSLPFMGLESHSVQFFNAAGTVLFSVYVGRENRQLIPAARESFFALREAVGTKEPS